MNRLHRPTTLLILLATAFVASTARAAEPPQLVFVCSENNDLFRAVSRANEVMPRLERPEAAIEQAAEGATVLILADGYPDHRTAVAPELFAAAERKKLTLYIEYPATIPGLTFEKPRTADWERVIVASDAFKPLLPRLHILQLNDCRFLPVTPAPTDPLLVIGRVAGFDTAVFGLPKQSYPILFEIPERRLIIATTCLSNFITARHAPVEDWGQIWTLLLQRLTNPAGQRSNLQLASSPRVRPRYTRNAPLPASAERDAVRGFADWLANAHLLVHPTEQPAIHDLLRKDLPERPLPPESAPIGDGSCGILEGFASGIAHDGSQRQRTPLRADCNTESAMCFAIQAALSAGSPPCATAVSAVPNADKPAYRKIAENLLDYVYFTSGMQEGERGDPRHPAFGHVAWGNISPAWTRANYGDDDARVILSTLLAAAQLKSDRWDERVMRALLANLRTTGRKGFRGERIDIPPLEQLGWKHFHDADTVFISPHYESGLWACFLWAYAHTQHRPFLDSARSGIKMTMEAYPDGWLWRSNLERARMLLCLAWLVRVEDTPEHRGWLQRVTDDLLSYQDACGAIREVLGKTGSGHGLAPTTNEEYGTRETPLLQQNGDPVSDQLYTTGFALFALREINAAIKEPRYQAAEDGLAAYLCRIQVRAQKPLASSPQISSQQGARTSDPFLDGSWFRAFDYRRWDYWASSADAGWGAWSLEAGWAQAWTAAALGLRQQRTSMWDLTAASSIGRHLDAIQKLMAINTGGPWRPPTTRPG